MVPGKIVVAPFSPSGLSVAALTAFKSIYPSSRVIYLAHYFETVPRSWNLATSASNSCVFTNTTALPRWSLPGRPSWAQNVTTAPSFGGASCAACSSCSSSKVAGRCQTAEGVDNTCNLAGGSSSSMWSSGSSTAGANTQ
eukprot:GHUV01024906.1.p3 GENE.GHUV01024906.1~~GHUV01024906.1.p3  ORF type:complete len:140 (-),score=34.29 GHUV01024906.1:1173-1592(-)